MVCAMQSTLPAPLALRQTPVPDRIAPVARRPARGVAPWFEPAALLAALIDALPLPSVIVDATARLFQANAAARQLLTADSGLEVTGGRVWVGAAHRFADAAWLRAETGLAGGDPGQPLTLRTASATAAGVAYIDARPCGDDYWLLTLYAAVPRRPLSRKALQHLLRLSPAEAALVQVLFAGLKPPEAATRLGIGRETAKTQLRSIFHKCGVESQAQLLQLVAAGPFYDSPGRPVGTSHARR
jgi:DNA-binding CsgD family transcriptional regulator